jgi:bifunctional non-homologous end joining protein LigD
MPARARARFVAPMLLLRTETLPDDPARWLYELKMDGYRAVAYKTGGVVHLRSRNDNFNRAIRASRVAALPDETVIDGKW